MRVKTAIIAFFFQANTSPHLDIQVHMTSNKVNNLPPRCCYHAVDATVSMLRDSPRGTGTGSQAAHGSCCIRGNGAPAAPCPKFDGSACEYANLVSGIGALSLGVAAVLELPPRRCPSDRHLLEGMAQRP